MNDIELKVQQVMADTFGVELSDIDVDSSQDSVDNWDSVNHLNLITALEEEFEIEIPFEEIGIMTNFKLVVNVITEML